MNPTLSAYLPDRAVLGVGGPDAAAFLQGLVTNDVDALAENEVLYAGLLTPQGKLQCDFFLWRNEGGYLIDCAVSQRDWLIQRLEFYRLRAKVSVEDLSSAYRVVVEWSPRPDQPPTPSAPEGVLCGEDPRLAALGWRAIWPISSLPSLAVKLDPENEQLVQAYHAHRVRLAVPALIGDFEPSAYFPHDLAMDSLHGISWSKGCYIGQEVVSRMQHRGSARKRILGAHRIEPDIHGAVPMRGDEIMAGGKAIGVAGQFVGDNVVVLVRLDRLSAALERGDAIKCGSARLAVWRPSWASYAEDLAGSGQVRSGGMDSGSTDSGSTDSGSTDSGTTDSGTTDSGAETPGGETPRKLDAPIAATGSSSEASLGRRDMITNSDDSTHG